MATMPDTTGTIPKRAGSRISGIAPNNAHTQATGMIDTSAALPAVLPALLLNGQQPGVRHTAPIDGQHNAKYLPE